MSERAPYGSRIKLPSLDNLFSTEQDRQAEALGNLLNVPLNQLVGFTDHPYQVRDDEEMQKMVESIKTNGVLTPLLVRPRTDGGYEMVSGHRRKRACELAGIEMIPVMVREMDDDTATILMVESNFQRENVSYIEKAKAYQMKLDAIKRQGRRSDLTSRQVGEKLLSVTKVSQDQGESERQIQRYIRLNNLIPELQEMVEGNKLKFNPAVELSFLTPEEQEQFHEYIDSEGCTPSLSQAQQLKAASKEKSFSEDKLKNIMTARTPSVSPREQQIIIPLSKLERYFPQQTTSEQIISQIIRLLEAYHRNRQRAQQER